MRFRLLPLLIVTASLTLLVRLGGVWHGLDAVAPIQSAAAGTRSPGASEGSSPPAGARLTALQIAAVGPDENGEEGADEQAKAGEETDTLKFEALSSDPFDLTDEEIELLQKLAKRRAEIDRRARDLEQRTALLEAAEQRIDEKVGQLKLLQDTIQSLLIQHGEQEEAQLRSLVKIYESMKPKDAARIFEELDMVVLLEIIERMKERKTAPILAQMDPKRAKAITLELANRRTLPIPKE